MLVVPIIIMKTTIAILMMMLLMTTKDDRWGPFFQRVKRTANGCCRDKLITVSAEGGKASANDLIPISSPLPPPLSRLTSAKRKLKKPLTGIIKSGDVFNKCRCRFHNTYDYNYLFLVLFRFVFI